MENQEELLNKKTGDKEIPKLEAKEVEVQGVRIDEVGAKKNQIVVLICKHPDKEELIELTKIKLLKNEKAKVVGLWYSEDEDKNIQKGSSLGELLIVAGTETPKELIGKRLPTIQESKDSQYLCIKGY